MNIRKPTDYRELFAALDRLVASELPQMELYWEIGKLICARPEKGAAVAAAEHLHNTYPNLSGFSPRNLRRMRDFCRMYGESPALLELAMRIGWTLNVVIMEADLTPEERGWYMKAAAQFSWTKAELVEHIKDEAHLEVVLDEDSSSCYTGSNQAAHLPVLNRQADYRYVSMISGLSRFKALRYIRLPFRRCSHLYRKKIPDTSASSDREKEGTLLCPQMKP